MARPRLYPERDYRNIDISVWREHFAADFDAGVLTNTTGRRAGREAGVIEPLAVSKATGRRHYYKMVNKTLDGIAYHIPAHILLWALRTGAWLAVLIDHKDGDGLNNRLDNLREATNSQNAQNRRSHRVGRLKGAYRDLRKTTNPWYARITVAGRGLHLGMYPTEAHAHEAYRVAARDLGGDFTRFV